MRQGVEERVQTVNHPQDTVTWRNLAVLVYKTDPGSLSSTDESTRQTKTGFPGPTLHVQIPVYHWYHQLCRRKCPGRSLRVRRSRTKYSISKFRKGNRVSFCRDLVTLRVNRLPCPTPRNRFPFPVRPVGTPKIKRIVGNRGQRIT